MFQGKMKKKKNLKKSDLQKAIITDLQTNQKKKTQICKDTGRDL